MLSLRFLATVAIGVVLQGAAQAASCEHNPDALGTARLLQVDPTELPRIGRMQYPQTLPLEDKEVVITFDDGPLPPYTNQVLETLASECVRATFFIVGRMARAYPTYVKRAAHEGHTIANHTMNHVLIFPRITAAVAQKEIDDGFLWTQRALGEDYHVTPFFRFPGLGRTAKNEKFLEERALMTWSADFPADDWTHISGDEVMKRALQRLEKTGKGVLLLHDIQPATAVMLPALLRELKARGYKVVHVEPKPQPNAHLEAIAKRAAEPLPVAAAKSPAKSTAKSPADKKAKPEVQPTAMAIDPAGEPKTRPLWPKTSRETTSRETTSRSEPAPPATVAAPATNAAPEGVEAKAEQVKTQSIPTANPPQAKPKPKKVARPPATPKEQPEAPVAAETPRPATNDDGALHSPGDFMTMLKNLGRQ